MFRFVAGGTESLDVFHAVDPSMGPEPLVMMLERPDLAAFGAAVVLLLVYQMADVQVIHINNGLDSFGGKVIGVYHCVIPDFRSSGILSIVVCELYG
jgi:hypothetical protein